MPKTNVLTYIGRVDAAELKLVGDPVSNIFWVRTASPSWPPSPSMSLCLFLLLFLEEKQLRRPMRLGIVDDVLIKWIYKVAGRTLSLSPQHQGRSLRTPYGNFLNPLMVSKKMYHTLHSQKILCSLWQDCWFPWWVDKTKILHFSWEEKLVAPLIAHLM